MKYLKSSVKSLKPFVFQRALPFILFVLTGLSVKGQSIVTPVDSLVAEANRRYMNLEYQEAAMLYLAAVDEGYASSGLYYNLGNACYKLNRLAQAILYYEKARELAPFDEDIRDNLQMANALIVDRVEVIPDFFLKRWWHLLTGLLMPDVWAAISLLLFVSTLFIVFKFITAQAMSRYRKAYLVIGVALFLLTGFGYVSGISREKAITGNRYAIIMDPSATIRSSPDELGTSVFVLHEGTKVEILERLDEWREIKIANGSKGWIVKNAIGEI
jgi:tetratricopeptide (TPR) repeat protein